MEHKLYLVSTPIGNPDDITLRALKILKESDIIACEKIKPARRILSTLGIQKELIPLNRHTEEESAKEVLKMIQRGKSVSLISDGGAPLFSDPGHYLVDLCIESNIQIVPVPGANSLIPALTGSGLDIEKFYYYGWLSANTEERRRELNRLKNLKELIVILDTPYRLIKLLKDVEMIFGKKQQIVVAYKLTMNDEHFFRGEISQVLPKIEKNELKGEFVLLIENRS
ncbi:MAG: 16S rRNA (cytidine(1402)-2'-O)-methyltransferase [Ignavibacteriales bacterium]|jgi:16S rRNA (cytidine1402-2'-O)-methyltransferase|nr:MAG: 16S rRNA (cytidine(1402)-2'-O)-methyltransferase [Ignavibacteriales bacterium]